MTAMRVLAIDQGTTNTKAVLVSADGEVVARASSPLTTRYPHPGWAEQSASAIWASVQAVIAELAVHGAPAAIAIANQRETLVVWDAETSQPICHAPIWQCRRTAADCADLISAGQNEAVRQATGLDINPLFPASKLAWVMRNVSQASALLAQGRLRAGTVDAWLLWNLTGGESFACDHSNAARTQLFDTRTLEFSTNLAAIFGAPLGCLPTALPSDSTFGSTRVGQTALPGGIPILSMMGDSHAALYGHGLREPGIVKATYGTGSSLMTLTPSRVLSSNGLSGTIAWSDRNGTAYALEGNITVSAQAAAFMASLLGVEDASELSDLAQTVADSAGVAFVPALAGLGAPHWVDDATGTIVGMTHGTTRAHLARAAFEAIALQIADVFAAMELDTGNRLTGLRADGGASSNAFLMQLQADLMDRPVHTADVEEIGAIGAAAMAFAGLGKTLPLPMPSCSFFPQPSAHTLAPVRARWAKALRQTIA